MTLRSVPSGRVPTATVAMTISDDQSSVAMKIEPYALDKRHGGGRCGGRRRSGLANPIAVVSVRTLQVMFRRHLDTDPSPPVRLGRANQYERPTPQRRLSAASRTTGASHTGRFAAAYRARYGVPPSATRRGRSLS